LLEVRHIRKKSVTFAKCYILSRLDYKKDKQVKIAKSHGLGFDDELIKQPHRLAKHHAMDCGQPGCVMCANPRKTFKEPTIQEKRFDQEKLHVE
jgi:hypothetical protein